MLYLNCQVCKNRCPLTVCETDGTVTGNKCARGVLFGQGQLNDQNKVLTYRAKTTFPGIPTVDVKTSCPIPKEVFFHLMRIIRDQKISSPMKRGDVLMHHPMDLDTDIIIDSDALENL